MAIALLVAVAVGIALLLLLARYAKNPAIARSELERRAELDAPRPAIDPADLRMLVSELLPRMGLAVVESEAMGRFGAVRIVAVGHGALRDARHIVYVEPRPEGEVVGATELLSLAEDVVQNQASLGVMITPYRIDRAAIAGIEADLELIEGRELLALVERHLAGRAAELRGFRLTGGRRAVPPPRETAWSAG
jgi:hypothetical protein